MARTIDVIFDGEAFRPMEPVDIKPNTHGQVVIDDQSVEHAPLTPPRSVRRILARARPLDAPTDLAAQHDR